MVFDVKFCNNSTSCITVQCCSLLTSSSSSSVCVMEVLRPALININGRIYRKNPVQEESYEEEEEDDSYSGAGLWFLNRSTAMYSYVSLVGHHIMWMSCSTAAEECLDEPCDAYNIEQTDRGFHCAIDVPSVLYKCVHLQDQWSLFVTFCSEIASLHPWIITFFL